MLQMWSDSMSLVRLVEISFTDLRLSIPSEFCSYGVQVYFRAFKNEYKVITVMSLSSRVQFIKLV